MKKIFAVLFCAGMLLMALSVCKTEAAMSEEEFFELCKSGTPQQVEAAIKAGADVNAKNNDGRTPLNFAVQDNKYFARSNEVEIVPLLLRAGATVSVNDVDLAQNNEKLKGTAVLEELKSRVK